ncbi:PREDICTED: uncharacterized protein LOC103343742 isoform X2 [Prunus mume]|uniref:Uncharacterized protein LOC103343742 isoform X2 n=1 Tax=Prunus mume TaxID=102107 RepID=A0ABM1LZ13_PRUMU|nr:PREDICTED: uncharacterized protein LOC103343743 isoform X2 [Prunus mume]XP_016652640.1 PREDICTED: uncharacterized protein LOC103343742 isoform X2 [Prunus mume]
MHRPLDEELLLTNWSILELLQPQMVMKFRGTAQNQLPGPYGCKLLMHCAWFVMKTWRIMDEKEISLNNICSLLIVHALCKGGYLEEVGFMLYTQKVLSS